MAELTPIQAAVLQVLGWQTPGYLCSPSASAFVSQGLEDPDGIEEALISLQDQGFVEFFTEEESTDLIKVERDKHGKPILDEITGRVKPVKDGEGNVEMETITQTVDNGWIITESGREQL